MVAFRGRTYGCHLELTIDLIGGKWKGLILWHIGNKGVMRFGELSRLHPGLTGKMLAQQLRELENDGLVQRKAYPELPPKVEYRLTQMSTQLIPILDEMVEWAKRYIADETTKESSGENG
jgi:DNA-binding HxlR family transcriptional regulator